MSGERTALLLGLGAVALWSTVATGFKLGLQVMRPLQLVFVGSAVALFIFTAAAVCDGWPRAHFHLGEALAFGLINPVLYYLILFGAYDRLPAPIAQPLNYT